MRIHKLGHAFAALLIVTASTAVLSSFTPSLGGAQVVAQTVDARKAEAGGLFKQGIEQFQTSQFTSALQSWQQALQIYREIKDRQGEGQSLGNLGLAYLSLGDYPKAIDFQQQRLKIAREIKDRNGESSALGNLGAAYLLLGDYPKAIDFQQQALTILREIKDRNGEGEELGNLGNAYYGLGDYPKAIDYQQQSLKIAREIKDRNGEGQSLGNLGNAYYGLGEYPKAIDFYQQALKIAQEIKDRLGEGQSLGNLGIAYLSLGDYPKAIDFQQQALKIAREIKDRLGEGNALGNLGNAYRNLGDYPKAIDFQQQALKIAREIKDRLGEGNALGNLGYALYKQGNLKLAESTLFDSIKVKESLRDRLEDKEKVSLSDTQRNIYITLQQVLIAQNKTDAALEIAERGRGRAFVELLADKISLNSQQLPTPPTIAEIQKIAKTQNATLVQYSIIYDDFQVKGKVQFKESELYIWVIKPTGEVIFCKSDLKPLWQKDNITLATLVENSRELIGVRGRGGINIAQNPSTIKKPNNTTKLKQLHGLLIKPIEDLLPKNENERIIFIPQASLFLVPFPALQDSNGKYLIEKHTISTAPAIQVLDLTHQQKQKVTGKEVVVMGNPTMPRIGIPPNDYQLGSLGGAEKEAKAIAALFKIKPILGNDATKDALLKKLPTARIIHLATHGLVDDPNKGIPTAIALAPTANDDGLLTLAKIFDLKINADLVVLSACDTGQGILSGDGVIGLSRSLISAGTPSVIVTLWTIPDIATSTLMTDFYQNLQSSPDKAVALRKAMLKTMKQYPEPVNWAAFTLIGEAQ
jgi:CHAT domain-containing protein/Flp pilus assembly protein TadD